MIVVYVCNCCGCFHGWKEGDAVVKLVTKHVRGPRDDQWWCPQCDKEHRTHDGCALGQLRKEWREATGEELALIEAGVDPRIPDHAQVTDSGIIIDPWEELR